MLTCEKCGVTVRGSRETCPLCQGPLTGTGQEEQEVFPAPPGSRHKLLLRIFMFAGIAAAVICVAINIMVPTRVWWSAFVMLGLLCAWASVGISIRKRNNLPKLIVWQVALLSALAAVWDLFTHWRGWSLDFAVPIICTIAMVVMAILARTMRLRIEDYMIYFIIDALFGVALIILLLTGVVHIIYPSVICITASVLSLIALLVFQGRDLLAELNRRMHL